jgi:hypothetical protein
VAATVVGDVDIVKACADVDKVHIEGKPHVKIRSTTTSSVRWAKQMQHSTLHLRIHRIHISRVVPRTGTSSIAAPVGRVLLMVALPFPAVAAGSGVAVPGRDPGHGHLH